MTKISLKGCTLKERLKFIKDIEMDKGHEDYRHTMGWSCRVIERMLWKLREIQMPKREYEFYGQPERNLND